MRSDDLWFPAPAVLAAAEHAIAATEHFCLPEPGEPIPRPVPSLLWVKHRTSYLSSNGLPRMLDDTDDPDNADGMLAVVHALGWEPSAHVGQPFPAQWIIEYIDLAQPTATGEPLIDTLRAYAARGGWLVITVDYPVHYEITFAATKPGT